MKKPVILVIGADDVESISRVITSYGFQMYHIDGRQHKLQSNKFVVSLTNVTLVIILTNFLNHNVMKNIRQQVEKNGIPFVACRKNVDEIRQALEIHTKICK